MLKLFFFELFNSFNLFKYFFSEFFKIENSWILKEFWPNSDRNSSFGSVPRRSNLSTLGRASPPRPRPSSSRRPARGRRARSLVERFDIEPYSDFSAKWSNYIGLVLFCIDAKFCKKICVWKLSPRSTQCTPLHISAISIFCKKLPKNSLNFAKFGN